MLISLKGENKLKTITFTSLCIIVISLEDLVSKKDSYENYYRKSLKTATIEHYRHMVYVPYDVQTK